MIKNYLAATILATSCLLSAGSQAQVTLRKGKVSGSTIDEQQKVLDFATISLLKAGDSSLVKTAMSDISGKFVFENVTNGKYLVSGSMVGYQKAYSKPFIIDEAGNPVQLDALQLFAQNKALKEVTITSSRPLVERKADKLIMNVQNSSVTAGSTALEVLQKAPGVSVDQNDNISMQGKKGVLIMLDGKQTYMSAADVANMLKNMPGSQIESIELITNPSARYDASGNSGIINIKTQKNKKGGTNGSITAGNGYGDNYRANTGFNLNHRNELFNVFGNYNYALLERGRTFNIDRVNDFDNTSTFFGQNSNINHKNHNNNFKAGIDLFLDKNNTLGFLVNGYLNSGRERLFNNTNIGRSYSQADTLIYATNNGKNRYRNMAYNVNYRSVLDSLGQELSFDADYSSYRGNEESNYVNRVTKNNTETYNYLRNITPSTINIAALKLDYIKPLNKSTKLEAGLKSSWVKTDNDFRYEELVSGAWQRNTGRSNQFIYDENINAGYLNLNREFKSTSIQLGLRAEQTVSKGNSITEAKIVKRDYLNLFPSAVVTQTLAKNHELNVSYSRRIDRPEYSALNPFEQYLDQYTFQKGNPFLNAQFANNYELAYTFKKTYSVSFSYSHTKDASMEVILPNKLKKSLFSTYQNLAEENNFSMNLNVPLTFAKWWNSNNNVTAFYLGYKAPDVGGQSLDQGRTAVMFNSMNTFIVDKNTSIELRGDYMSSIIYGTFEVNPQYGIDLGISRSFMNKKANIKFGLNDVLNTRKQNIKSVLPGFDYNLKQKNETRVGNLTFTYRFGSNEVKPARRRTTGLEDEQKRLKN